jgi:hypothetical protein
MIIPKDEQEVRDFDWFGVDADGHIGHFTTAGFKYLPGSVSSSEEDLQEVTGYFDNEAPIRGAHRVDSESIAQFKGWKGEEHEARYLASFALMADKGLYSYDIDTYVRAGIAYSRVAVPLSPLTLNELPDEVRRIVQRTILQGVCFGRSSRIDYESTLGA